MWDCATCEDYNKLSLRHWSRHEKNGPFGSIEELARRVPELSRANLRMLAEIGALNTIGGVGLHRRDALWQVEKASQRVGSLFEGVIERDKASPLSQMDTEKRLVSDYHGTGLTIGPHPMFYRRAEMRRLNIKSAAELRAMPNGKRAIVAGAVITRQRSGTASGLIFLTMEDETGYANVIVMPHIYEKYRQAVLEPRFVCVSGTVQNQDGIIHLKAEHVEALMVSAAQMASHDFH